MESAVWVVIAVNVALWVFGYLVGILLVAVAVKFIMHLLRKTIDERVRRNARITRDVLGGAIEWQRPPSTY